MPQSRSARPLRPARPLLAHAHPQAAQAHPSATLPYSARVHFVAKHAHVVSPLRITLCLIPARVQLRNLVPRRPPPRFLVSAQ
ncbi:hypothetical protein C8J57DRAFT_1704854, partial [Mycena rebaudengoi]